MAFGKKKTTTEAAEVQQNEAVASETNDTTASKKTKKKSKKEMVSSVVDESVLEQVIEECKANTQFISTFEGEPVYVGMLLKTDDIGGLSLKTNKDEAKGTIVEEIKNGRIKVYASAELLENESFVIIPDVLTLDAISEFSLLDIDYELVKITEDGLVHTTGLMARLSDVTAIAQDETMTVNDIIGDEFDDTEEVASEEDIPELDEEEEGSPFGEAGIDVGTSADEVYDDEAPVIDESVSFEQELNNYEEPSVLDEGIPDDEELGYEEYNEQAYYEQPVDETPQIDYSADDFAAAITRTFFSDDLGLIVTTDAFDQQFMHNNLFVPFAENRPSSWMNDYLNNMSKNFNQELYRLHQQNLVDLRNEYFTMISLGAQDIVADCDYTTEATIFGEKAALYRQQKNDAEFSIEESVARKKDEINAAWEAKISEVGEIAAQQAMQQYRDRYHRQHQDDILRIQPNILDDIETTYNEQMRTLHEERKSTASKKMDAFVHEALQHAATHRIKMLEEENARYHEMQAELQKFMDENRKDEIARSEALAQQLAQTNAADQVLAEQTEKLRNMAAEFDAKKLSLLNEIEATEQKRKSDLDDQRAKYEEQIAALKEEKAAQQAQIDKLVTDLANIDSKKEEEWKHRYAEKDDELIAARSQTDHVIATHKRSNIIATFLVAAGVIAACAVGFIAGEYININKTTANTNAQIISEYQNSINRINNGSTNVTIDGNSAVVEQAAPQKQVETKVDAVDEKAPVEEKTDVNTDETSVDTEEDVTSSPKTDSGIAE